MLDAGFARILIPERIGGYGLGFEEWFDVTRELSKADASHGWCAGLIIHHAHLMAQFPEAAQKTLWANGLDVPVAASFAPAVTAVPVEGGYRISGAGSPFASGVDHSTWVMLGGMAHDDADPEWKFFLVPQGEYTVRDTWFTAGMRATGSKTIVTDHVFVPHDLVLGLSELRDGRRPRRRRSSRCHFPHAVLLLRADLVRDADDRRRAGCVRIVPQLDQDTQGAGWFVGRRKARRANAHGARRRRHRRRGVARPARRARADAPAAYSPQLLARSVRDFTRASELCVEAIDALLALSGTAGFATSHPMQRAWRDIHFMAMHISLNVETNFAHFGRMELGLGRDASRPYF